MFGNIIGPLKAAAAAITLVSGDPLVAMIKHSPAFVKRGELIRVDTGTGLCIARVKE